MMKKFAVSLMVAFLVVSSSSGSVDALSCQAQGNSRGSLCVSGGCPTGWRSVFWDTGCKSGQRCYARDKPYYCLATTAVELQLSLPAIIEASCVDTLYLRPSGVGQRLVFRDTKDVVST
ncbi:hypothetical protein K493DRAFT_306417 [Basidiobolus meristosporus CBS 931.73]|uniref:CBM1 domain-containing protein n=1 Tax=Basidiobolus meristosporus CBS 931.73 TaxID=1314790 RepID=A0A1Y1XSM4_9FUNG|nr:hypothetical protein K493DRAFT_306417 [Basidiobolus meristosporus CBS 931.73]|eukprot:ORX88685.1 hypothetical protein K493DRAFT_306417 [Basidiobolus meristosporus CBS 931.73]